MGNTSFPPVCYKVQRPGLASKKQGKEGIKYFRLSHIVFHWVLSSLPALFSSKLTFSVIFLLRLLTCRSPSCCPPNSLEVSTLALCGFPNSTLSCLGDAARFLGSHSLLTLSAYFLSVSALS